MLRQSNAEVLNPKKSRYNGFVKIWPIWSLSMLVMLLRNLIFKHKNPTKPHQPYKNGIRNLTNESWSDPTISNKLDIVISAIKDPLK